MLAQFGYGVLVVSFIVALYSVIVAFIGDRNKSPQMVESARRAQLLIFPLLSVSALVLIALLLGNHFEVRYVYEVTSTSMPTYLKVTAWWGGQAGSLLFWAWLLSAFTSAVTLRKWDRDQEFLPWIIIVSSITAAFFISMNVFFENPFAQLYQTVQGIEEYTFKPAGGVLFTPTEGRGLNPLLRHPGMVIHPPMLYLGFVSFVIPFAFAIAALVTGRTDDRWIRITRRWTLWAWLFLSFGIVLGGRWAYDVLGWGGYWGWDPVEIASFMPWLTGTALLHSVMIQEKRGMLKHWNMILIVLTYSLVIFGTFLTRSGVLSSVHSFAQSAIGPMFFSFIGVTFITSISLLIWRWPELKSETEMKSMFSREALFLLNNLLFMSILVVCFWGVISPLISELATGQKITVGPPFYERANAPLFAILMLLMGIAPLSAWGLSSVENMGTVNKPVLGGILSIPTIYFLARVGWRLSNDLPINWTTDLILFAVALIVLVFLYLFRRAIWQAAIVGTVITIFLAFTYTQNLIALLAFFMISLTISVTLREFWRGTRARQRAQQENFFTALGRLASRNRRRYGGYLIHISMMLMAIGILGIELFQVETQGTLSIGDSMTLSGYTVKFQDVASWDMNADGVNHTRATVDVYDGDKYLGKLYPRKDLFFDSGQPMSIPGQWATLKGDLYVLLVDWQPISASGATFKVYVNPLVNWLWIGALFFIFGILFTAWPEKKASRKPVRAGKRVTQTSAAD
jgi:cytochrome c-type biogenesis protein CcmF